MTSALHTKTAPYINAIITVMLNDRNVSTILQRVEASKEEALKQHNGFVRESSVTKSLQAYVLAKHVAPLAYERWLEKQISFQNDLKKLQDAPLMKLTFPIMALFSTECQTLTTLDTNFIIEKLKSPEKKKVIISVFESWIVSYGQETLTKLKEVSKAHFSIDWQKSKNFAEP